MDTANVQRERDAFDAEGPVPPGGDDPKPYFGPPIDDNAPRAVPAFGLLRDEAGDLPELSSGWRGQMRHLHVSDAASLVDAIERGRQQNPYERRNTASGDDSRATREHTVYAFDAPELLPRFLAETRLEMDGRGALLNVFAKVGDEGPYAPVKLHREYQVATDSPLPMIRHHHDAEAPFPYRIAGSKRWQAKATSDEVTAYFADSQNALSTRAQTAAERAGFDADRTEAPEQIVVGPHVDFTHVYGTREQAHAAFGDLVGDIAGTRLRPGGFFAPEDGFEYGAMIVPHDNGYQLMPPFVSIHNDMSFVANDLLRQSITQGEQDQVIAQGRVADIAHTHPAPQDARLSPREMHVISDGFSTGDLDFMMKKVCVDPQFAMSVYAPAAQATQVVQLSEAGRRDIESVNDEFGRVARGAKGAQQVLREHPEWFEVTGVRTGADGQVRTTDWLQTMRESDSAVVREIAEEMARSLPGPPTAKDLLADEAVRRAAERLDLADGFEPWHW